MFSAKIAKQGRGSLFSESERLSRPLIGRWASVLSSDWSIRTQPSSGAAVVWSEPEPQWPVMVAANHSPVFWSRDLYWPIGGEYPGSQAGVTWPRLCSVSGGPGSALAARKPPRQHIIMREIVHIQAGQCGNQIGAKVSVESLILILFCKTVFILRLSSCQCVILSQKRFLL